jgi:hypothetical protein
MYTSIVLVALAGSTAPSAAVPRGPTWLSSYEAAYRQGSQERKPLAVVFGTGSSGWDNLSKDGRFTPEIRELLDAQYVCVYVDTDTSAGKRLASSFEITDGPGLVISDRTGKLQAFRHEGELSNRDLERYLNRFADPDRVVRRTETSTREEIRAYPPSTSSPPSYAPVYAPSFAPPSFGGFGGFGGRGC